MVTIKFSKGKSDFSVEDASLSSIEIFLSRSHNGKLPTGVEPRKIYVQDKGFVWARRVASCSLSMQELFVLRMDNGSFLVVMDAKAASGKIVYSCNEHLKEIHGGEIKDLYYLDGSGMEKRLRLILPPNFVEGQPCPCVCWIYPGAKPEDDIRSFFRIDDVGPFSLQLLSSAGYVVIELDLSFDGTGALDVGEMVAACETGVEAAVQRGFINVDNVHLMGQSLGGWAVMILLAKSRLFKSAISMAGISNIFGLYGHFDERLRYLDATSKDLNLDALVLNSFGVIPDACNAETIVSMSPSLLADLIERPLLLIHGDCDYVPLSQSEYMFSAMQRLRKKVCFVRYRGEGHIVNCPENIRDLWRRILEWLLDKT